MMNRMEMIAGRLKKVAVLLPFLTIYPAASPLHAQAISSGMRMSPPEASLEISSSQTNKAPSHSKAASHSPVKPSPPRYEEVGKSVRGRSIQAIIYGTGKKRVVVVGGIHGDEPASTIIARALSVTLGRDSVPDGLTVVIVPDANPDALASNIRVNSRGVDVNRNFPSKSWKMEFEDSQRYPGTQPASEPETRALINLLERYPPDLLITLHAALGCVNWDGPASHFAAAMARVNGYPLCAYLGYDTPGSLGTYAGIDRQIPMVTIELRGVDAGQLVQENLPALLATLKDFAATDSKGQQPIRVGQAR